MLGQLIKKTPGILFNSIFLIYIALLQPFIFAGANDVLFQDEQRKWLGILLLVLFALEIPALIIKIRQVTTRTKKVLGHTNRIAVLWTLHLLFSTLVGFVAIQSISVDFINGPIGAWLFALILLKEFILLFLLTIPPVTNPGNTYSLKQERIAEAVLIAFACITYTAFWESLISSFEPVHTLSLGGAAQILIFIGFFLIIFLPARFGFTVEEWLQPLPPKQIWLRRIMMVLAIVFGLLPILF